MPAHAWDVQVALTVGLAPTGAIRNTKPVTRTRAVRGVTVTVGAVVHPVTDVPAVAVARTR